MDTTNFPPIFRVFKPLGHTVITYWSGAARQAAVETLTELGFASSSLVRYTPAEMIAQADAELLAASPLKSFCYELDLVRAHRVLAKSGCSFLVVEAQNDELAESVAIVARATHAAAAQHYGRFMVEEVIEGSMRVPDTFMAVAHP